MTDSSVACLVTQDAGPSKPGGSAPKVSYADKWVCIIIILHFSYCSYCDVFYEG